MQNKYGIIITRDKEENMIKAEIVEIPKENRLEFYYEKLNCDLISHVIRKIDEKLYDIIIDDEFLLKEENIKENAIMIDENFNEMIFGKALICKYVEDADNFKFFNAEEISAHYINIMSCLGSYINCDTNEKFQAIRYKF